MLADAAVGTQGGPLLYIGNYGMVGPTTSTTTMGKLISSDWRTTSTATAFLGRFRLLSSCLPDGTLCRALPSFTTSTICTNSTSSSTACWSTTRRETDGVEAMWSHVLTNNHYMAKHQNNEVTFSWGARFLKVYDEFNLKMLGSVLHDVFVDTSFTNQIVGPQVGAAVGQSPAAVDAGCERPIHVRLQPGGLGSDRPDGPRPGAGRLEPAAVCPGDRVLARAHRAAILAGGGDAAAGAVQLHAIVLDEVRLYGRVHRQHQASGAVGRLLRCRTLATRTPARRTC